MESALFIGAIRLGARAKLTTYRGAVNGRTFIRFVKTRLGPWLRPGDIVVMDLNMHKMNAVRQAIVDVGSTVIYSVTYADKGPPNPRADRRLRQLQTARDLATVCRRR